MVALTALRAAAVAAAFGSAGCYASHERPLDRVACAPFEVSSDGVITNALNARFEVDSVLTLRSVAFAWRESPDGARYALGVVGELVNRTSSPVCPDTEDAVLTVNGAGGGLEVMGVPHLLDGAPATCLGAGENGIFVTSLEATTAFSRLESIARVSLTLGALPTGSAAVPDPEAPTFGAATWSPAAESPDSFEVSVPITGDSARRFGTECAIWSPACDLALRPLPAGVRTSGGRRFAVALIEEDPATWTDREVRCHAIPYEGP
jgi:hypothetical protein